MQVKLTVRSVDGVQLWMRLDVLFLVTNRRVCAIRSRKSSLKTNALY